MLLAVVSSDLTFSASLADLMWASVKPMSRKGPWIGPACEV